MLPAKKNYDKSISEENKIDFENLEFLVETILSDIKKRKAKQNLKKKIRLKRKKTNSNLVRKDIGLFEEKLD